MLFVLGIEFVTYGYNIYKQRYRSGGSRGIDGLPLHAQNQIRRNYALRGFSKSWFWATVIKELRAQCRLALASSGNSDNVREIPRAR